MRHDLQPLRVGDEVSADLRILTSRRTDKAEDHSRAINRLRATLLEYFPALEAAFDYSRSKAALTLLTRHNTPAGIRRPGHATLQAWLKKQGARSSATVAEAAVAAAREQHTVVPGQRVGCLVVAALLSSLKSSPESRVYFDRKRAEGKSHIQAILCLARRRVNVLWATLRDGAHYAPPDSRRAALPLAA